MRKITVLVAILLLVAGNAVAGTYYASPTGAAIWANCEHDAGTPGVKTGTAACSLSTANTNADAGDTVYLRAGTYSITGNGIAPTNSGTSASEMITFSGYESEVVTISGAADSTGGASQGIALSNDSYIKITKINFSNLYHGFTISGGGHNEISYCTFAMRDVWADVVIAGTNDIADTLGVTLTDNNPTTGADLSQGAYHRIFNRTDNSTTVQSSSATATTIVSGSYPLIGGTDNKWDIGDEYEVTRIYPYDQAFCDIGNASTHNYIHHNTMHGNGGFLPKNGADGAPVLQIGKDIISGGLNSNTTIEFNHLYNGGHHVLGVNQGLYQVVRGNYIHNESWFDDTLYSGHCAAQGGCGYRVMSTSSDYGGYDLIEGNYIAFGAQYGGGNLADGGSGSGLSIGHSNGIVRYNSTYGNVLYGMRLSSSLHPTIEKVYVYNNTMFKNGYDLDSDGDECSAGCESDLTDNSRTGFKYDDNDADKIKNNVVKNNIFYSNWSERNYLGTTTYYSPLNTNTAEVDAANTEENNYLSSDWSSYPISKSSVQGAYAAESPTDASDLFTDPILPIGGAAIISAWSGYAVVSPDLTLKSGSSAINGGTYLTTATEPETSGTTLVVADASYFQDGTWGSDLAKGSAGNFYADWIAIGTVDNVVQIQSIDYSTNTITLETPMTWADNAPIWLYKKSDGTQVLYGSAPDIGAHERSKQKFTGNIMIGGAGLFN